MLKTHAQRSDVLHVAEFFASRIAVEANRLAVDHARPDGREIWTKAIWHCFDALRIQLGAGWNLYPKNVAKGAGRAGGEYLVDFMLMDDRFGPRIACESELGSDDRIDWAFDKLRGVKADIKLFIFEKEFERDGTLPKDVDAVLVSYLADTAHFVPGEYFLLIQLDHDRTRSFVWEAESRGPFTTEQIRFSLLARPCTRPDLRMPCDVAPNPQNGPFPRICWPV